MKEKALQILLVEDNAGDARLLREMFSKEKPGSFELTHLLRLGEAVTHLAKGGMDIVLLDMGLPDGHGLDTVRRAHAAAPDVPVIVLTGLDDEALAAEAMKAGAQDYLIKGQIENRALPRALRHAIERHRMQTETDLIRRHQMEFKDEFLSHVSHELRSPLTAIYQFVTILLDKLAGELNPEQKEYLEIVLRNVKQLQSMISDLVEVTRMQEGKLTIDPQCTSVSDAIAYTVGTLQGAARGKAVGLSLDLEPLLPSVYADPTRIRQILIILVDNAIKFTSANGAVKVQAHMLDEDPNFMVLEISDSGCGISPDMTERIFERLYQIPDNGQAGRKGMGLGLHICKELVTRQGGRLWVTSSPQGSIFSFTLPIFSLAHAISPLLKNREWPADSVALVTIEIRSPESLPTKETREEWSRETRSILQRCVLPDLDILLPKMGPGGPGELFQLVAFADEKGVAVLTKRIREQFQRMNHCKESGLIFSTSSRPLERARARDNVPKEELADEMAARIEDLIKSERLGRNVNHG
jgi:signal transduction histidine kinase